MPRTSKSRMRAPVALRMWTWSRRRTYHDADHGEAAQMQPGDVETALNHGHHKLDADSFRSRLPKGTPLEPTIDAVQRHGAVRRGAQGQLQRAAMAAYQPVHSH